MEHFENESYKKNFITIQILWIFVDLTGNRG